MTKKTLQFALSILSLLAAACGSSADGGDGTASDEAPVSDEIIEQFCGDYAALACENERICCSEGGDEDCEYFERVHCKTEIGFAITHYDLQFHLASAESYLDTIAARGEKCQSYPRSLLREVKRPFEGVVGDVCADLYGYKDDDADCANSYCAYDEERSEFFCTAFKALGDVCEEDEECGPGAACPYVDYGVDQVCTPTVGEGESCLDDPCGEGLWCDWDLRVCVPTDQPTGASCVDYNGCDGFCDEGTCAPCKTDDDCYGTECWDGTCSDVRLYAEEHSQDRSDDLYCIANL